MAVMLTPRWNHRLLQHHLPVMLLTATIMTAVFFALPAKNPSYRWCMATAYGGLALIGATLVVGVVTVLRGRVSPVSSDLRRDVGFWAAVISVAHVVIGLQRHFHGRMWLYFVFPSKETHWSPLRTDKFGLGNYTGLIATLILFLLLALSNDASLRWLGARRWKRLQRWNYAALVLVLVHGVVYQVMSKRTAGWVVLFAAMSLSVIALQLAGFRHR